VARNRLTMLSLTRKDPMASQDDRIVLLISKLERVCAGQASRQEADEVIRAAQALSAAYLRLLERRGKHLRDTGREVEYELLAADCIAELFQQSAPCHFPRLAAYFAPLFDAGRPAAEIYSALIRLLTRLTTQHATRLFRQRDPEGAKLWRNVIMAVKKEPGLILKREIGGWYILTRTSSSSDCYQPDSQTLTAVLGRLLLDHRQIGPLLATLFDELAARSSRPVWIAVADITHIIRTHRRTAAQSTPYVPPEEQPEWAAYDRLMEETLAQIRTEVIENYLRSGKITPAEGLALYSALVARSRSQLEKDAESGDHALVTAHWPEGLPMTNPQQIFTIFDYLLRIFRQKMQKKIDQYF